MQDKGGQVISKLIAREDLKSIITRNTLTYAVNRSLQPLQGDTDSFDDEDNDCGLNKNLINVQDEYKDTEITENERKHNQRKSCFMSDLQTNLSIYGASPESYKNKSPRTSVAKMNLYQSYTMLQNCLAISNTSKQISHESTCSKDKENQSITLFDAYWDSIKDNSKECSFMRSIIQGDNEETRLSQITPDEGTPSALPQSIKCPQEQSCCIVRSRTSRQTFSCFSLKSRTNTIQSKFEMFNLKSQFQPLVIKNPEYSRCDKANL